MAAVAQAAVHSQGTKGEFAEFAGYGQKRRYYTPAEVAMHNCTDDCWVTVCGKSEFSMLYVATYKTPALYPFPAYCITKGHHT